EITDGIIVGVFALPGLSAVKEKEGIFARLHLTSVWNLRCYFRMLNLQVRQPSQYQGIGCTNRNQTTPSCRCQASVVAFFLRVHDVGLLVACLCSSRASLMSASRRSTNSFTRFRPFAWASSTCCFSLNNSPCRSRSISAAMVLSRFSTWAILR